MERLTDYPEWESGTRPAGWGERIQVQKDMFDFQGYSKKNE